MITWQSSSSWLAAVSTSALEFKELQRTRKLIDDQRAQLAQAKDQASKMNQTLQTLAGQTKRFATVCRCVKLRSDYGSGCLLDCGTYYFVSGTGRPLRYPEAQMNESGRRSNSGANDVDAGRNAAVPSFSFWQRFYVGDGL